MVEEVQKAWTLLNTPIRFQGMMQETTFMCAPTNIYLDYIRNTCVEEVATATRVQPRSYSGVHCISTLLLLKVYYICSHFSFQLPALYYDFLFQILCILFTLPLFPICTLSFPFFSVLLALTFKNRASYI
jgi:hypothetical protein